MSATRNPKRKNQTLSLLPRPRSLKFLPGIFTLPEQKALAAVRIVRSPSAPAHPEGYALTISKKGVLVEFRESGGLRAATVTLQQLMRQCGRRLPCLKIRDWPDFARRGVMLDISRGRVPRLETLLDLAEVLSDFKINELQLYTEHTFAYQNYRSTWQSWGALTGDEVRILDQRCHELGIDLVPNQNSFGHLRYLLEHPKVKPLAEIPAPYEDQSREFVRRPTTLAPNHPGTLPLLQELYDELLPNFSSDRFNVGCDETWDLGRGRSKRLCDAKGRGRVYLDFLKKIHREVSRRGKQMMFWGDIILKYPKLIPELASFGTPGPNGAPGPIALNWGYEADHPFAKETARFARSKISFYVCPGTSTWQTLVGKHDNALANLKAAAKAGKENGAIGYLITDWGDGGHPQPLAVSWPMFLAGAALAWNATALDDTDLLAVLGRDVFEDDQVAASAFRLGFTHRKLGVRAANETPLGTVIAASPSKARELFCRNGLKWFGKIPSANIRATLKEIEKEIRILQNRRRPVPSRAEVLRQELELAARMAAESCRFMLWQQAVAAGKSAEAKQLARTGIRQLKILEKDFQACWPMRNKATPKHSTPFLRWRMDDYRCGSVR